MKNKNKFSIRTIVAIGIGAAVFMILGRFGSIPSGIPNTNIETSYAYLALMAILYGPAAGFLIGNAMVQLGNIISNSRSYYRISMEKSKSK